MAAMQLLCEITLTTCFTARALIAVHWLLLLCTEETSWSRRQLIGVVTRSWCSGGRAANQSCVSLQ